MEIKIRSKKRFNAEHLKKLKYARKNGYIDEVIGNKKLCPNCNKIKTLSEFHKSKKRTNGYQLWCNECGLLAKKKAYHTYRREPEMSRSYSFRLKKQYNMTLEDYYSLSKKQDGKCDICKRKPTKGTKTLVVDHNHKNNKNRGLLCNECNFGLGKFEDNISFLENAINYLKKHDL